VRENQEEKGGGEGRRRGSKLVVWQAGKEGCKAKAGWVQKQVLTTNLKCQRVKKVTPPDLRGGGYTKQKGNLLQPREKKISPSSTCGAPKLSSAWPMITSGDLHLKKGRGEEGEKMNGGGKLSKKQRGRREGTHIRRSPGILIPSRVAIREYESSTTEDLSQHSLD